MSANTMINNEIQKSEKKSEIELMTEDLLLDTMGKSNDEKTIKIRISELATLGAGASSLIPKIAQITQTVSIPNDKFYRLVNKGTGEVLKKAKNGDYWGSLKRVDGSSKMLRLRPADPLTTTTTTKMVLPVDPATIMMAAALYSIEKEISQIAEMEREILSFLELEKQSEIEADVETLMDITRKYKSSWDNEHFVVSNHKLVLDIQRTARKNINFHYKKISEIINDKKLTISQNQVTSLLNDLKKRFQYYRLSLYTYSLSSLMEIMLGGNFKEEYIIGVKNQIASMSIVYRDLFDQSSLKLESISSTTIESNILKGVGTVGNVFGKAIGKIPLVEKGSIDEFLKEGGEKLKVSAKSKKNEVVREFADLSNPKITVFTEKMDDMIAIFNHSSNIGFDAKYIYLSA